MYNVSYIYFLYKNINNSCSVFLCYFNSVLNLNIHYSINISTILRNIFYFYCYIKLNGALFLWKTNSILLSISLSILRYILIALKLSPDKVFYNIYPLFYYLWLMGITLSVVIHQLDLNYLLYFLALLFVIYINAF